jgi:drug/metabolite transporter (DMT)-like permease
VTDWRLSGVASGKLWPLAMLVFISLGVGLQYSLNRLATVNGVPFIPYVFWMSIFSGTALLALAFVRGAPPPLRWPHLRAYGLLAMLGMAVPITLFAFIAPKLPASIISLVQSLIPGLTYMLAMAFGMERWRALSVVGIGLGLAGVLLIVVPETSLPEPAMAGWTALAVLGPVCFALSIIGAARFRPPEARSVSMSAGVALCAALFLLPAMAVDGSWWFFDSGFDPGAQALIYVSIFYFFFWLCFFEIVRLAGPVFFSTVNYLATFSGVVWGMIFFGESFSPWVWGAFALMVAGLYVMGRSARSGRRNFIAT